MVKKIYKLIRYLSAKGVLKWMPDKAYIKLMYKSIVNKKLDINNPRTFNEKLQWLKLNDRNPLYISLVDKYEVREYVKNIIGEEYLIPLLGIYNSFDEIKFNNLPNEFALKCTHDSGGVIICYDKSKLNIDTSKNKINKSLKRNYYYWGREWPYKGILPRIICEELIKTQDKKAPIDYKFHCFNGEVDNVMICLGRESGNTKFYFFNKDWKLLRYNVSGVNAPSNFTIPKPKLMDKMFEIAKKLSKGLTFVRVDLYCENDQIYFGELTFFPESGFDANLLESTDKLFGSKINIEKLNKENRK